MIPKLRVPKTEVMKVGSPLLCGRDAFHVNHPNGYRRIHPHHFLLQYTISGSGLALAEDRCEQILPGFATFAPNNTPVTMMPTPGDSEWTYYYVAFSAGRVDPDLIQFPDFLPNLQGIQVEDESLRKKVATAFDGLVDAMQNRFVVRRQDLAYNRLEEILIWLDVANTACSVSQSDARIGKAVQHIKMNYREKLTVESLASVAGLGESRFAHLFTDLVGSTPMKYLETIRLAKACELLESSSFNISQIAYKCGFNSICYFSKLFKRRYGVQATAYRHRSRR